MNEWACVLREEGGKVFTTLLANDIVNRMKIRQQPDLAD
jgi:hypothetical protein